MQIEVIVQGIDIHSVQPQQGPPSVYDGRIRIMIVPRGASGFETIETGVPFQHGVSLAQSVKEALGSLREYGEALAEAATEAAKVYR